MVCANSHSTQRTAISLGYIEMSNLLLISEWLYVKAGHVRQHQAFTIRPEHWRSGCPLLSSNK